VCIPARCTAGCRGGGATGRRRPTSLPSPHRAGRLREAERAELERLRRDAAEKNKRIRELERERDVLEQCMALWVK
jgi:transposase